MQCDQKPLNSFFIIKQSGQNNLMNNWNSQESKKHKTIIFLEASCDLSDLLWLLFPM